MSQPTVRTERTGAILRVTLDRPEKLNALNLPLIAELTRIAADVHGDPTVRAVVLTGAGRAFCAGADLKDPELAGGDGTRPDGTHVARTLRNSVNPMIEQWYRLPVPVIVAVNGVASGAGVSLALVGDIVTAAESASFGLPFISRLGIVPDLGATYGLPQRLSAARIKGLALLGESISAQVAAEWGLIWNCVADAELAGHVNALAERLANGPTCAIAALKSLLADAPGTSLVVQLERETLAQGKLADSEDFHEGLEAFRQKRTPKFHGR